MALKAKGTIVVPNPTAGQPNVELDIAGGAVDSIDTVLPSGFIGTPDPSKNVQLTDITTEDNLKLLKNSSMLIPGKYYVTEDGGPHSYLSAFPVHTDTTLVPNFDLVPWSNITVTSITEIASWTSPATGFVNVTIGLSNENSTMNTGLCYVSLRDMRICYAESTTEEQYYVHRNISGPVWIEKGETIHVFASSDVANSFQTRVRIQLNDYKMVTTTVPVVSSPRPDFPAYMYNCILNPPQDSPSNLSFLNGYTLNGHTIQTITGATFIIQFQQGVYDPVNKIANGMGAIYFNFIFTTNTPLAAGTTTNMINFNLTAVQINQMMRIDPTSTGAFCTRGSQTNLNIMRASTTRFTLINTSGNLYFMAANYGTNALALNALHNFSINSMCDFHNVKFL